jgi:hypothetical protein
MTEEEKKATIDALRKTTANATKSKTTALKYLAKLGLNEDKSSRKSNDGMITMAVSKTDEQLLKWISHLNNSQRKLLAEFIKSFISIERF